MLCSPRRLLRDLEGPLSNRIKTGSVARDNRRQGLAVSFGGKTASGSVKVLGRFPTKAAAWKAAKPLRDAWETKPTIQLRRANGWHVGRAVQSRKDANAT